MIGFDYRGSTAGEPDDQQPTERGNTTHGFIEDVAAYRIVDDIGAAATGQFSDLISEPLRVIDHMIGPHLLTHGEFFCRARRGDDGGTQQFAHIHGSQSHSASGTVY